MLKRVETIRTKCTLNELITGLIEGWLKQFGELPKKECIGVLYAQNALETGGTISMWNYNIGNVKAVDDPNSIIEYFVLNNVWEIIDGKRVILSPNDPGSWFRAFPTLGDGIAHHLNFLRNKRYKISWSAVESGDPAMFSHLLKKQGYYTASEADYTKLMKYYFNQFMKSKDFENAVSNLPKPAPVVESVPVTEPVPVVTQVTENSSISTPVESIPTQLPLDHKPINDISMDSAKDRAPIEITKWNKFIVSMLGTLKMIPWIQLISFIISLLKKKKN